jgi:hypothetical protein
MLIQGFSGAYGPRTNATEVQLRNEEPDPERLQVHIMDADRYGFCEFTQVDRGLEFKDERKRPAVAGRTLSPILKSKLQGPRRWDREPIAVRKVG